MGNKLVPKSTLKASLFAIASLRQLLSRLFTSSEVNMIRQHVVKIIPSHRKKIIATLFCILLGCILLYVVSHSAEMALAILQVELFWATLVTLYFEYTLDHLVAI